VDQALFELPEHALGPSWAFLCACVARPQELLEGARVLVRLALELPENAMGLPGPFFVCVGLAEAIHRRPNGCAPREDFSPLGLGLVILL
jgi:hypothetical protein